MNLADDCFGNLVDVTNPFGLTTRVYTRIDGRLASFVAGTGDHEQAIRVVRDSLGDVRLSRTGRWKNGPVLAVISGLKAA